MAPLHDPLLVTGSGGAILLSLATGHFHAVIPPCSPSDRCSLRSELDFKNWLASGACGSVIDLPQYVCTNRCAADGRGLRLSGSGQTVDRAARQPHKSAGVG